jgi:hypothetical protein
MVRFTRLLQMALMVTLVATPIWAANALIVQPGTGGIKGDADANLTSKLVTAGFTVTHSVGVPGGSLANYQQIWDIRSNNTTPLTASDTTAYMTYLQGGGKLFAMGENSVTSQVALLPAPALSTVALALLACMLVAISLLQTRR